MSAADHPSLSRVPRLLMATPHFFPSQGGVETHVHEVSRRLAETGFDVTVLAADVTGELPEREQRGRVAIRRVRAWPGRGDLMFAPSISAIVRRGGWDVIHVQSYHTLIAPAVMLGARRAGIPYVLTFHGGGHSGLLRARVRGLQLRTLRPLLAGAARLVVLTEFEVERYGGLLGLGRDRFVKIPNGCDLPALPAGEAVAAADGTLVLSVGRLERYKGHQHAIGAVARLVQERPDVRLRIVGTGPYEQALRTYARELGVADRVEIRGVPSDDRVGMAKLLASASLVVLLSEFETHPVAVLEALSLGRPVVVTDGSGLSELAASGAVRAVPLGSDERTIAEAMLAELGDPHDGALLALPTWDECAGALAGLYRRLIGSVLCAS